MEGKWRKGEKDRSKEGDRWRRYVRDKGRGREKIRED